MKNPSQCTSANLTLWLDATANVYKNAGTTLAVAGTDTVQQWNDQSTNANNWSQATSGNRPSYVLDTYKGVYMASGADTFMGTGTAVTTNNHIWFVAKIYSAVAFATFWGHNSNIDWLGDGTASRLFDASATANLYGNIGSRGNAFATVCWINGRPSFVGATGAKQLNEWCIYELTPTASSTVNQFRDRSFTGRELDAAFGDVAVFDATLSSGDRTDLYAYFSNKYNIPIVGSTLGGGGAVTYGFAG